MPCSSGDARQCFEALNFGSTGTVYKLVDEVIRPGTSSAQCADDIRYDGRLGTYRCRPLDTALIQWTGDPLWSIGLIGKVPVYLTATAPETPPPQAPRAIQPLPPPPVTFPPVNPISYSPPSPLLTLTPTMGDESCPLRLECFDALYSCTSCCQTGQSSNGLPCWDFYYTKEECCDPNFLRPSPVPFVIPVQFSDVCIKEWFCFDGLYPCDLCCETGVGREGQPCWEGQYSAEKCCMNPTTDYRNSIGRLLSQVDKKGPLDSRGNPLAVDSRGYPLWMDESLDSRGRLRPEFMRNNQLLDDSAPLLTLLERSLGEITAHFVRAYFPVDPSSPPPPPPPPPLSTHRSK